MTGYICMKRLLLQTTGLIEYAREGRLPSENDLVLLRQRIWWVLHGQAVPI